ncbi:MAG: hypothetical protein WCP55_21280, partial [Lentisphaerota bacterium]
GNAVLLSSGGSITVKAGNTVAQFVNAPLVIQNANGSGAGAYTNLNYSTFTLTLGGAISGAATVGNTTALTFGGFRTSGSDTISGVISDGSDGGKLALAVGTGWGVPNTTTGLGGGQTLVPLSGTWLFSGNSIFTGPTTISAGSARLSGTTGRFSATGSLTVNGNATFYNGDASTANNNDISDRVNPSATLTLGGVNGGGSFQMASPAAGKTHSQSFAGLTVGAGQNTISSSAATGTNKLTFTGAGSGVYTRNTGGIVNFRASGLTNSFSNVPAGASVSGGSGNEILIGAVLDGSNFVKASSGIVIPATYVTTMTADANVNVTGGNFSSGTLSINSLKFSDAAVRTNTISGTLTIASGGILTGPALTTGSAVITGGSLTSGTGDLWIYANGNSTGFNGATSDPRKNNSPLILASKITGNNALTISGNSTDNIASGQQVTLSNTNNDYSGGTFLSGGKLIIAGDGSLGASNGTVTAVSGVNVINPSAALTNNSSRNFVINGGATLFIGQIANASIAGKVSGSGTLGASWYDSTTVLELTGDNSGFNGLYQVNGNLRAASGVLSPAANLAFLGTGEGKGFLETSGTFTRQLGLGAGQVQWG